MSDTVWLALIAGVFGLLQTILSAIVLRGNTKIRTSVDSALEKVEQVHLATNSMKDALVSVTEKEALARGKLAGAAEEKAKG